MLILKYFFLFHLSNSLGLKTPTPKQKKYTQLLEDRNINLVVAHGPAGTGKSWLACKVAIEELKSNHIKKIVLTRPVVPVEDENLGFLPGTIDEKMNPWIQPLYDIFIDEKSKLKPGSDVVICLDVAANELMNEKGEYSVQSSNFLPVDDVVSYYKKLTSNYPIKSIEDPFAEDDWQSWKKITSVIGNNVQIVGDDLFVTNSKRLEKGIKEKSANSILVKPNQIGTLTETLEVISMAKKANFSTIISHRSGDTEDTFIADLAVATMSSQIKTGSLARSERVAKYNRLLRVEEELGNQAKMTRI